VAVPQIHRFTGRVKICMYPDHAPPHFHLRGPGWSAVISLSSLTILRGYAPPKELRRAVDWARANKELLKQEWERLNERDG
jgi:hypothetical protein